MYEATAPLVAQCVGFLCSIVTREAFLNLDWESSIYWIIGNIDCVIHRETGLMVEYGGGLLFCCGCAPRTFNDCALVCNALH